MILEEETFEDFGYYSQDLSPRSSKKIIATCDNCGKKRETNKHDYRSLCSSCVKKKKKINYICLQCNTIFKDFPSISNRGRRKFCSRECSDKWKIGKSCQNNPKSGEEHPNWKGGKIKRICETCDKEFEIYPSGIRRNRGRYCSRSCKRKAQKIPKHHTKPERIFEQICKNNNLPFKYTGDGSFWIHNINPDFVECNGKKIAVEVFGDYWHSPLLNPKLREDRTLHYRKKILKRYGWKLIVFWESDLLRRDIEVFVLNTIKKQL